MTDDADHAQHTIIAGGQVDELRLTLRLYGADLDPDEISRLLQCKPTKASRRGDSRVGKKTGRTYTQRQGAWLLCVEGRAPQTADELAGELLAQVPDDRSLWAELSAKYEVQFRLGVFLEGWNRGFSLCPAITSRLGRMGAWLVFDIYANLDDDP